MKPCIDLLPCGKLYKLNNKIYHRLLLKFWAIYVVAKNSIFEHNIDFVAIRQVFFVRHFNVKKIFILVELNSQAIGLYTGFICNTNYNQLFFKNSSKIFLFLSSDKSDMKKKSAKKFTTKFAIKSWGRVIKCRFGLGTFRPKTAKNSLW